MAGLPNPSKLVHFIPDGDVAIWNTKWDTISLRLEVHAPENY